MMYVVVLLAVLVGFIWALVVFPSFRVVAIILIGIGLIAYFVLSEKAEQERKRQEAKKEQEQAAFEVTQKNHCIAEQKRWLIVPASQVEIRSASLKEPHVVANEYDLTAAVKNKSKVKVTALTMNVIVLDCSGKSGVHFTPDRRYRDSAQVEGLIAACDLTTSTGLRDLTCSE